MFQGTNPAVYKCFVLERAAHRSGTAIRMELNEIHHGRDIKNDGPVSFHDGKAATQQSGPEGHSLRWRERVVITCLMIMSFIASGEAVGLSIPMAVGES